MLRSAWRKLFTNFTKVWNVIARRGGYWCIEWPDGNAYWENPLVKEFFDKVGSPIYQARAAGCAYNLRAAYGQEAGQLMGRAWFEGLAWTSKGGYPRIEVNNSNERKHENTRN